MNDSSDIQFIHELIAALDRRLPQGARPGEATIARDSAALRARAIQRLIELAPEPAAKATAP